jgi:hypothetical protein
MTTLPNLRLANKPREPRSRKSCETCAEGSVRGQIMHKKRI